MARSFHVVLCADRSALPGVHVAAYSLLARISRAVEDVQFHVFGDDLVESDIILVRQTLAALERPCSVLLHRVEGDPFGGLPTLYGSWTTYYRILVPQYLDVPRLLYLDADTFVDVDVSVLNDLDMTGYPAAFVAEAPLSQCCDRDVARQLEPSAFPYFNAGVMLVNLAEWRRQEVTARAVAYLEQHRPQFWDQSALNAVLHGNVVLLDGRYNAKVADRVHWEAFGQPRGQIDRIVHATDYPKPWELFARRVHPQYKLWRETLDRTALRPYRAWLRAVNWKRFPRSAQSIAGYRQMISQRRSFARHMRSTARVSG
jgi:lipopolysaccharide biosynthesis glycosyltransferase